MQISSLKSHKSFNGLTQFWEHESALTKTKMKFSTFVPEGAMRGCLIWLSGLTCTDENFITKAGAQKYLADNKLMVLCPDTSPRGLQLPHEHDTYDFGSGASFYVNATTDGYKDHYLMEDYIVNEVYEIAQDFFKAPAVSIFGHSMGGHGALTLGLNHPKKFKSVSAFSPIVHPSAVPWGQKALKGYLGDDELAWKKYDATELVLSGKKHPNPILIDQGTGDEFLENQLKTDHFTRACDQKKQPIKINMRKEYDHSYYFISTFIKEHVDFHSSFLR